MQRNDFPDNSIEQLIFCFAAKQISEQAFRRRLRRKSNDVFVDFIAKYQAQGAFGKGLIHE